MIYNPRKYQLYKFWDEEFKTLDYVNEPFNDPDSVALWRSQGYQSKICGELCDMRHRLPEILQYRNFSISCCSFVEPPTTVVIYFSCVPIVS